MFGLGFLGKLGALASSVARAWSPLALWPDGIATPGMWISPRDLTSQWADYNGTTPVATPGTVADSSNPVGLALDIRAGAPEVLGPELVVNGDFSDGSTGWTLEGGWTVSGGQASITSAPTVYAIYQTGLTPGKTYLASFTISSISAGRLSFYCGGSFFSSYVTTAGTHTAILVCGANGFLGVQVGEAGTTAAFDNISFKEVPGNHMLQSTSAARPLLSARVNLLTYTEDFSNAVWGVLLGLEKTPNYALAPDGTMTACRLYAPTAGGILYGHGVFVTNIVRSVWAKSNTGDSYSVSWGAGGTDVVTPTWQQIGGPASGFLYLWQLVVDEAGGDISVWHPQVELGSADYPYQSVPGDGSTYATGFPIAQLYDGVDDGMATAAFAAGTLIDGMDCMIAVRRDLVHGVVCGLHRMQGSTQFIAAADPGQGWPATSGAGSPTTWVDGAQLAGGTATSADTLNTALTVGDWHIIELRGLDLSAWTSLCFGWYGSAYNLNGPRGDILLYPSTASTTDKDAARQWLADYYGVTLP